MATGWEMQLTRQIGEHLVVAELRTSRLCCCPVRGERAVVRCLGGQQPWSGDPHSSEGINGGSWQFDAKHYLNIENASGEQVIQGAKRLPNPKLLCIFGLLNGRGKDEFYLFHLSFLSKYTKRVYRPRGRSSKNPKSTHCAISPKDLIRYKENWKLLETVDTIATLFWAHANRPIHADAFDHKLT